MAIFLAQHIFSMQFSLIYQHIVVITIITNVLCGIKVSKNMPRVRIELTTLRL
jgi:hypothetical protein